MSLPTSDRSWVPLTAPERRVLGVLVEKAKTTPEYYPLTIAAIVTGCNQKSNRDPITDYDADDVEDILTGLRKKGAVVMVEAGGRVVRYKHTLYDWLKVSKVELAVVAELLLRGSQTEGDLRARSSRMEPLADLPALQTILDSLAAKELIVYLSPRGVKRGVVVTHNLYPPNELEREKARFANAPSTEEEPERTIRPGAIRAESTPQVSHAELAAIRADVAELREAVRALTEEVRELKSALGA
ncbi:YceH family protein [Tundrisphaera lichenicola]|uniref:YceH family protein n=1 Tax=Tundrisphaera lichenicola TaxID=2029860 RepID=UPI003EB9B158